MALTRRQALSGLAACAAASAIPARAAARADWDIAIVGAGTAGLPAALFAARRGLRVVLLEKAAQVGGTLWFSGGQMSAAGTRRQRSLGLEDSAEDHLADILRISRGTAQADLVRRAVTEAGPTLDWLDDRGFVFGPEYPLDATGHEPYLQRRVWGGPERGLSVLEILQRELAASAPGPRIVHRVDVRELVLERRRVRGVRAIDESGTSIEFRARHVVLASGGYMANPSLFESLNGVPQYRAAGWPLNTGIGVDLALQAGGRTRGRENYLCDFGSVPAGLEVPSPEYARTIHHPQRRLPWEIWINTEGRRFIAEDDPSIDRRERALLAQPHHRYWVVFDQGILESAPPLVRSAPPGAVRDWTRKELQDAFDDAPAFTRADSLAALATAIGVPAGALRDSVLDYGRAVQNGSDSLGRRHCPRELSRPPFYAIRHQGGTLISMAGVAVDDSLRVLRGDDPIPGLYAIGELLGNGSLSGQAFCSGMMVTPALALGRWLGKSLRG